jgi:hypothetical protein
LLILGCVRPGRNRKRQLVEAAGGRFLSLLPPAWFIFIDDTVKPDRRSPPASSKKVKWAGKMQAKARLQVANPHREGGWQALT